MILPPVIRVFFAIALPTNINNKIDQYVSELKKISRTNKIRWTRPENLHITLQFLADVRSEDVSTILREVESAMMGAITPISFTMRELLLFPDPYRPRVLVMDVAPQEPLAEWSALVGKGIQQAGYEIEDRQFRAHLTLGRLKTSQTTTLNFLQDIPPLILPDIQISDVTLFQSEPHPDGSRYIPLAKVVPGGGLLPVQNMK